MRQWAMSNFDLDHDECFNFIEFRMFARHLQQISGTPVAVLGGDFEALDINSSKFSDNSHEKGIDTKQLDEVFETPILIISLYGRHRPKTTR